jgi:hypothetical protein
MFVRKLLKKRRETDAKVYVDMKNIDAPVEEDGNNVIIMTNQGHTIKRPNEPVCI